MNDTMVQALRGQLRGELITPADSTYEEARKVYNGMIDKRPGADRPLSGRGRCDRRGELRPRARDALAVRGGGHNGAGLASCDGGTGDRPVAYEGRPCRSGRRTVRVEGAAPGAMWTTPRIPSGWPRQRLYLDHRVGGLTLGGGMGYLSRTLRPDPRQPAGRRHGAGRRQLCQRQRQEHADLFWAVRGGGGNFGVVTSFLFRGHPMGQTVYGGPMFWPMEQAPDLLRSGATSS